MKVLIEAQSLLKQRTGVGQYTFNLIDHMVPLLKEKGIDLTLFYFNFLKRNKEIPSWNGEVHVKQQTLLPGRFFYFLWKKGGFPPFEWLAGKNELIHFPNFIVRPFRSGKAVVTIHDLSFVRFPRFAEKKNLDFLNRWIPFSLEKASKILVVSEFTKKEMLEVYGIDEKKVVVAPNGVSDKFKPEIDPGRIEQVCRKYRLPGSFMLAVGTLEPRKNVSLLIKALSHLKKQKSEVPPLVLVGPPGWNKEYERLKALVEEKGLTESVKFLFYVERGDMRALYSAARLLVFPSVYEGFGLPVLEAMACATPVIASNAASLPEVSGEAALQVPPDDPQAWSEAVDALWDDAERQKEMAAAGLEQVKKFTWKRTAQKTLEAYEQALRD